MYIGDKRRIHAKSFRWFGDRFNHYIDQDHFMGINPLEVSGYHPPANIKQADAYYDLELTVPGFKKNEIKVTVDNNILTVKGEKTEDVQGGQSQYIKMEHSVTAFERSFELHSATDTDNITAEYQDGILRIRLRHKPGVANDRSEILVE